MSKFSRKFISIETPDLPGVSLRSSEYSSMQPPVRAETKDSEELISFGNSKKELNLVAKRIDPELVLNELNGAIDVGVHIYHRRNGLIFVIKERPEKLRNRPGGKLNQGEYVIACLARELREELGCALPVVKSWFISPFKAMYDWRVAIVAVVDVLPDITKGVTSFVNPSEGDIHPMVQRIANDCAFLYPVPESVPKYLFDAVFPIYSDGSSCDFSSASILNYRMEGSVIQVVSDQVPLIFESFVYDLWFPNAKFGLLMEGRLTIYCEAGLRSETVVSSFRVETLSRLRKMTRLDNRFVLPP